MLRISINKNGGACTIEAHGSMLEITPDLAHVINALYIQVKQSDSVQAMLFREAITQLAVSEKTPLWEPQGAMTGICFSVPNNFKEDM